MAVTSNINIKLKIDLDTDALKKLKSELQSVSTTASSSTSSPTSGTVSGAQIGTASGQTTLSDNSLKLGTAIDQNTKAASSISQSLKENTRALQQRVKSAANMKSQAASGTGSLSLNSQSNLVSAAGSSGFFSGRGGGGGSGGGGKKPPKLPNKSYAAFNGTIKSITGELGLAVKSMVKFTAAAQIIGTALGAVGEGFRSIVGVNKELTGLNKVLATNKATLDSLRDSAVAIGVEFGQSVDTVLQGFKVFAQQGLGPQEIQERGRAVALGANVSTLNTDELSETITALLKVFPEDLNNSAERLIDSFVAVESANAVTAADLAEVGRRVGVAAKNAGVSFDELNAITTVVQEATRSGGTQIGTAFRRILLNIQTDKAQSVLGGIGIQTQDLEGNFVPAFKVLQQVADVFPTLTDTQKRNVTQTIAQTRFTNQFLALLENFPKVNKVVTQSQNASGIASERNEIQLASLSKQSERTSAAFQGLAISLGDGLISPLTDSLKIATNVLQILTSISNIELPDIGLVSGIDSALGTGTTDSDTKTTAGSAITGIVTTIVTVGTTLTAIALAGKLLITTLGLLNPPTLAVIAGLSTLAAGLSLITNRTMETAQDNLSRRGITGDRTKANSNLAQLEQFSSTFETLAKRQTQLNKSPNATKEQQRALQSSLASNSESLRQFLISDPETANRIEGLRFDADNNVTLQGKNLEEVLADPDAALAFINSLKKVNKEMFAVANAITVANKAAKSFGTGFFSSLNNTQSLSKVIRKGGGDPLQRRAIVSAKDVRATLQSDGLDLLLKEFEKSNGVSNIVNTFIKEGIPLDPLKDIVTVLASSGGTRQGRAFTAALQQLPKKIAQERLGSQDLTAEQIQMFDGVAVKRGLTAGYQIQTQEERKQALKEQGRLDSSGTVVGSSIKLSDPNFSGGLAKLFDPINKGSQGFGQVLDSSGKKLKEFNLDVNDKGQTVLTALDTKNFKKTEITGAPQIASFFEGLKGANEVIFTTINDFAKTLQSSIKKSTEGFGAGRSIEIPALKVGASSLLDFSDSSAAAFEGIGESGAVFNEQLQQVIAALSARQESLEKSGEPTQESLVERQQLNIFATLINSVGRVNKVFESFSQNIAKIDLKRKLDEIFSPSALNADRAFGGRNLQVTLGKTFNELTPEERAIEKFPNTFGQIEKIQTVISGLGNTANDIENVRNQLSNILNSQDPDAFNNINVDNIKKLFESTEAGFSPEEASKADDLLNNLRITTGNQDKQKIIEELSDLIPDSSPLIDQVEKLRDSLRPLEVAAKSAIAIEKLAQSAEQAARSFKTQVKTEGFFDKLNEGIGTGLNAIAGSNAPVVFSSRNGQPALQERLSGSTNLELQKSLNNLLSSREVRSGVVKIFDQQGNAISPISEKQAKLANNSLNIQAGRERQQRTEQLRNQRLNTFTNSLTKQFSAIDDILQQGNLSENATSGLKSVQRMIEREATAPARRFVDSSGKLRPGATDLLTKLPKLIAQSLSGSEFKSLPDSMLKNFARSGNEQAQKVLDERQQKTVEPLIEPAKSTASNTKTMVSLLTNIASFLNGNSKVGGDSTNSTNTSIEDTKSNNNKKTSTNNTPRNPRHSITKSFHKSEPAESGKRTTGSLTPFKPSDNLAIQLIGDSLSAFENGKELEVQSGDTSPTGIVSLFPVGENPGKSGDFFQGKGNIIDRYKGDNHTQFIRPSGENKPPSDSNFTGSINPLAEVASEESKTPPKTPTKEPEVETRKNKPPSDSSSSGSTNLSTLFLGAASTAASFAPKAIGSIVDFGQQAGGNLINLVKNAFNSTKDFLGKGVSTVTGGAGSVLRGITGLVGKGASTVTGGAGSVLQGITGLVGKGASTVTGGAGSVLRGITGLLGKGVSTVTGGVGGVALRTVDPVLAAVDSLSTLTTAALAPVIAQNPTLQQLAGINMPQTPRNQKILEAASTSTVGQSFSSFGSYSLIGSLISSILGTDSIGRGLNLESEELVNSIKPEAQTPQPNEAQTPQPNNVNNQVVSNLQDLNKKADPTNIDFKRMSEQEAQDLAKAQNLEGGIRNRQQDVSTQQLSNINTQLQEQTVQAQTGIEVTNTEEISTAVREGIESTELSLGNNLESSLTSLTAAVGNLITALTNTTNQGTVGGQLAGIEERLQSLIQQNLEPIIEETNSIRTENELKLEEVKQEILNVERNNQASIENTRSELDNKISTNLGTAQESIVQIDQKLLSFESDLQSQSTEAKSAITLANQAQQKADQVDASLKAVQSRITQASLNNNGY